MADDHTDSRSREHMTLSPRFVVGLILPLVAAYVALFAYAMENTSYNIWGAVWLAPVLFFISVPLLLRFARGEPDRRIGQILVVALALKLIFAIPRYYMVAVLYETGDALRYAHTATLLRESFLNSDFSLTPLGTDSRTGTQFVEIVSGIVYTAIGPSIIGGFIFFSWLSFWGLFFFYRAFRVGIPNGDSTRYAMLLFLLPSMLFWPSSIGKEAWMTLVVGIATYGSALLLARRRGASAYLVAGLAGVIAVRPHMALLVIAGLSLGYLLRSRATQRAVALGKTRTVLGLAVIGLGTMIVIRRVSEFFGIDEFNLDTAVDTLEYAEGQTAQGGSEFDGGGPSLQSLPLNIITVLFRPFAFEVDNIQALIAALEGTFLLVLFLLALPRLRTIPRQLRRQPYVTYCITYAILFCFMFSAFQNFGILARQRVLVFPLVLVLLALPLGPGDLRQRRRARRGAGNSVTHYATEQARE